jgi:hypothetical protein
MVEEHNSRTNFVREVASTPTKPFCNLVIRDIGMPVFFDTRLLALVTPSARFYENDKPGQSFIQPPESTPT